MSISIGVWYLFIASGLLVASGLRDRRRTRKALTVTGRIALTVLPILLLIFVLMGTIEAFVSKEAIATWMGTSGGGLSVLVGEVIPFAGYLHDSGANYGAVYGFVMTAILIGLSTIPIELKLLGRRFTLLRNLLTFTFVFLIGLLFLVLI